YQAAMGNHEGSGVLFKKYVRYPFVSGRYWSFDYGPAHFAVIDQYTPYGTGSAQLLWLEDDLASTLKPWKFIILHAPGWSAGGHANNSSVQNYIQPLCETYGVPIVFAGHNHYYARAVVNGIHHVTTGGGGAPLYTPNPSYPNVVYAIKAYNYCKLEIRGGVCHFTATTRTGTVIDTFTVTLEDAGYRPKSSTHWFTLSSVEPNPFDHEVTIHFSLDDTRDVGLDIYDVRGRRIRMLIDGICEPGQHSVIWDGKDETGSPVGAGIYFCRLTAGERQAMQKIVRFR
ncbi:MAG TPA: T9SS type A sorting domain-containing protein, partial [Firmicutes bacterium]|nr:T9SS type A sorting domain-containing protein [Bacillota bacterium]